MKDNIRIYEIKSEYIKYLSNYQKHIFLQTESKNKRKYIGIVFEIGHIKYFAPLSSYKDKHKKMKEGVDFIKIKDYAVINLNNMIPVPDKVDPEWRELWRRTYASVLPGYHQNKEHWNTVILDGTVPTDEIKRMIAESYDLVVKKKKV